MGSGEFSVIGERLIKPALERCSLERKEEGDLNHRRTREDPRGKTEETKKKRDRLGSGQILRERQEAVPMIGARAHYCLLRVGVRLHPEFAVTLVSQLDATIRLEIPALEKNFS